MKPETAKATKKAHISIDSTILADTEISHSAFRLYCILVILAGDTNHVCVRIKKLANLLGRSARTVRYELNTLIDKGVIERVYRKNTGETKEYLESLFIIHDRVRDTLEA